jgi:hypothetical protein
MNKITKGTYRHYKGNLYQVIDLARNSENYESMVIYRELYDNHELWVRPLSMFLEEIEVNGKIQKRFEFLNE